MYATARVRACAVGLSSLLLVIGWSAAVRAEDDSSATPEQRGRRIFLHEWKLNDPLGKGDGLGPVFNERSCVACHFQGGVGGGGANDRNVDVLTAEVPTDATQLKAWIARARKVHPGFAESGTVVLHRFSTNPVYPLFRLNFVAEAQQPPRLPASAIMVRAFARRQATPLQTGILRPQHDIQLTLTQRSATALFGARLIDKIPSDELVLLAAQERAEEGPIHGRVVGRFGWRGQIANLREFVLGACAIEVGLNVPNHAQDFDPQSARKAPRGLDLSAEQCDDLIAYIGSLPRPRQLLPADPELAKQVEHGRDLFEGVGCAVCHRPTVGRVEGLYSDLLVHDMGQLLSDPAGAPDRPSGARSPTAPVAVCHSSRFASSSASSSRSMRPTGYFGGSSEPSVRVPTPILAARRTEWRTPPLWGVGDSAPYLHDGRAATIHEAVRWHGGEAADTVERYLALDSSEREDLALFLATLAAPGMPPETLAAR